MTTNLEHSLLTGSSLHEPKGVASAAANRVYVSDGLGSGSWTTVSPDVLATSAKPFQAQLLHIKDLRIAGTNSGGGTFTANAWQTRTFNTVFTNEITGASLSSNQITLPLGVYWISARAPGYSVGRHQIKWKNVTDSLVVAYGSNAYAATSGAETDSTLNLRFTSLAGKVWELQHWCENTVSTSGMGFAWTFPTGDGPPQDLYSEVLIWKLS